MSSQLRSHLSLQETGLHEQKYDFDSVISQLDVIASTSANPAIRARATIQKAELKDLQNPPETVDSVGIMLAGYKQFKAANDSRFGAEVFFESDKRIA